NCFVVESEQGQFYDPLAVVGDTLVYAKGQNVWAYSFGGAPELILSDYVSRGALLGDRVILYANGRIYGTDGSAAGTVELHAGSIGWNGAIYQERLYFGDYTDEFEGEYWRTDGTVE